MLKVTLLVRPLESWAVDISKELGTSLRIVKCTAGCDGLVSGLVEFNLDKNSKESVMDVLIKHPDIKEVHISDEVDGVLFGSLTVTKWLVCSFLQRTDCYIEEARTKDTGSVEWQIVVTNEKVLQSIIDSLEVSKCKVDLVKKRKSNGSILLTKRQEMILEKALEMGYFDYPRGVTAKELARRLSISQSTLYETMQDSHRKLVERYLLRVGR